MLRRFAQFFRGPPPPHPRSVRAPGRATAARQDPSSSSSPTGISASGGGDGRGGEGKESREGARQDWLPEMVSDAGDHKNKHDDDIDAAMAGLRGLASVGEGAEGGMNSRGDVIAAMSNSPEFGDQGENDAQADVRRVLRKFGNDSPSLVLAAGNHFQNNEHKIAAEIWRTASDDPHNDTTATYSYGMCLREGYGVEEADPRQAVKYFARAARKGHPWAQYALAHAFHKGEGVEVDNEEALTLYKLAARNGIPPAPFNVANMYAAGEGVDKDDAAAVEWYERAAELGDPKAQFALGSRHCSGRGVEVDWEVGYEYHVDAANAGYAPAQFNTGTHYFLGQGVEQNLDTAVEWFKKASDQGMPQAQVNLARMFLEGYGVTKDRERGISLLRVAAEEGRLDVAKEILDKVLSEDGDKEIGK